MVGIDVVVHGVSVGCEDEGVWWEVVDIFQFAQNVGSVASVSGNKEFDSLELEVQPATPMVHKGAAATNDRTHFPRRLVSFQSHTKACKLGRVGLSRSS